MREPILLGFIHEDKPATGAAQDVTTILTHKTGNDLGPRSLCVNCGPPIESTIHEKPMSLSALTYMQKLDIGLYVPGQRN